MLVSHFNISIYPNINIVNGTVARGGHLILKSSYQDIMNNIFYKKRTLIDCCKIYKDNDSNIT